MPETATIPVVVLAYNGTEPLLRALWEKSYTGAFKIMSVPDNYGLLEVLTSILVDTEVAEEFVLVQANTFPLVKMNFTELSIPAVYVTQNGNEQYNSRVPTLLSKERLAEALSALERESDFNPERTMKACAILPDRPLAVSHTFGNYIFQVITGSPCEHRVIEGLIRRRFMGTTVAGWNAIRRLLIDFLKTKSHE